MSRQLGPLRRPLLLALALGFTPAHPAQERPVLRHYVCYRSASPVEVDGWLSEAAWQVAPLSQPFVDIEGAGRPAPRLATRFRLLWDDTYLYVAAELEEPHVWATLVERDAIIYHENDFELFIDPDGDTQDYYEIEINALGTVWDLMLDKPYRDGGSASSEWDIDGLRAAVAVRGTINDPSDRDRGWTVELAIPWSALVDRAPGGRPPRDGESWRLNFSRVQWQLEVSNGRYVKSIDMSSGTPFPESNWVWSPQGAVNMHMPELWGIVQFSRVFAGAGEVAFTPPPDEDVRWGLRRLYYRQRDYRIEHGRYADDLSALHLQLFRDDGTLLSPDLWPTADGYEATATGSGGTTWYVRQDGKLWSETGAD